MYLVRLYRHSKPAGMLAITLLLSFIYLNYKWGFVATPLLQFGMYSRAVTIEGERIIYSVVDKHNPDKDFFREMSFRQRDQLTFYLNSLEWMKSNEHVFKVFSQIFTPLGMNQNPARFGVDQTNSGKLEKWIGQFVIKNINTPNQIQSMVIIKRGYRWDGEQLQYSHQQIPLLTYESGK